MPEQQGSEIYFRMLAGVADCDLPTLSELLRKIWSPTPWMLSVKVGVYDDEKRHEILQWCLKNIGNELDPIRRRKGVWREGNVTINHQTWYGFATEEMMSRFIEQFKDLIVYDT